MDAVIWHNPRCSKSRGACELLTERGVDAAEFRYLDEAPDRAALEDVLRMLGTEDPLAITRTGEARFRELGLKGADRDTLLDALAAHPELIERPIVVVGGRAVVARPPERLLELLDPDPDLRPGTVPRPPRARRAAFPPTRGSSRGRSAACGPVSPARPGRCGRTADRRHRWPGSVFIT